MSFNFAFTLGEAEQVRASRVMYHRRWSTRIVYGCLLLLLVGGGAVYVEAVSSGRDVPAVVVPIGLAGLAGAFGATYMSPYTMVRALRERKRAAAGPHQYALGDAGLQVDSPGAKTSIEWANIAEAYETREFFFFYLSKGFAALLPKRAVATRDLELLRLALRGWVGPRALLWLEREK